MSSCYVCFLVLIQDMLKPVATCGYKAFLYSTQLTIKTKYRNLKIFSALKLSYVVFILLINVKM